MLRGALLLFLFGVAVSGCSSVPPFDAPEDLTGVPTVSQVIDKINCEILEARDDPANDNKQFNQFLIETLRIQEFKYWQASVTLTLTVNDTVGLYPSSTGVTLSYIDPLRIAGTSFMFSGSVMLYQSRARTYTQQYSIDISKINPENCGKDWHRRFNLEGDLGIRDQIAMGLHSFEQTERGAMFGTSAKSPDNIGGTVSFHIYKGVTGLGPNWTIVHFKGPVGGVGYNRDDLHQIAFTIVPVAVAEEKKPKPPCPIKLPPLPIDPKLTPPGAGSSPEEVEVYLVRTQTYSSQLTAYTMAFLQRQAVCGPDDIATGGVPATKAYAREVARAANQLLNSTATLKEAIQGITRP